MTGIYHTHTHAAPRQGSNSSVYRQGSIVATSDALSDEERAAWRNGTQDLLQNSRSCLPTRKKPHVPEASLQALSLRSDVENYTLSGCQAHGWFGMFRQGIDSDGRRLGFKQVFYHADDLGGQLPLGHDARLHSQRYSSIQREVDIQVNAGTLKPLAAVEDHDNQQMFIVMPLMQADVSSLIDQVKAARRADLAWSVLAHGAGNLAHCHAQGVAHLDLKTANLLWDERGTIVVSDFGLADYVAADGTLTEIRGARLYLPPEAIAGRPYTVKADTWMLGTAILHVLLPSQEPFRTGWRQDDSLSALENEQRALDFAKARLHSFECFRTAWLSDRNAPDAFWKRPMARARAVNPELFDYLMHHMMVPKPEDRAPMHDVFGVALEHLHALPPRNKMALRKVFSHQARTQRDLTNHVFAAIKAYRQL